MMRARIVAGFQQTMGGGSNDETLVRMFEAMANEMPLRALPLFSGGRISVGALQALIALANGQPLKALGRSRAARRESQHAQ